MITLYWFGRILSDLIGSKKLMNLYMLGAASGGLLYLLIYNVALDYINIPKEHGTLIGASGAVYAIVVAAATLSPGYTVRLFFTWDVKIIYIAAAIIFLSFIGTTGGNAGGNFAHLGGALFGFVYIKLLRHGTDIAKPFNLVIDTFTGLFKKKSNMKVSYRNDTPITKNQTPDQKEIDAILDKISRSGYESLSKEEKQKLFRASQK